MDRQGLQGAAELATLLALVPNGLDVLGLDVQVEVGALHHHLADGALPVRPLQLQHHGSDFCERERHVTREKRLDEKLPKVQIQPKGCKTGKRRL